jgi:hypothetical protein
LPSISIGSIQPPFNIRLIAHQLRESLLHLGLHALLFLGALLLKAQRMMIVQMMLDQSLPSFQVVRKKHIVFVLGKYLYLAKLRPQEVVEALHNFEYEGIKTSHYTV